MSPRPLATQKCRARKQRSGALRMACCGSPKPSPKPSPRHSPRRPQNFPTRSAPASVEARLHQGSTDLIKKNNFQAPGGMDSSIIHPPVSLCCPLTEKHELIYTDLHSVEYVREQVQRYFGHPFPNQPTTTVGSHPLLGPVAFQDQAQSDACLLAIDSQLRFVQTRGI